MHKHLDSEGLTPKGILQMGKTAEALKKYNPDVVYCSREKRAIQSARIISEGLDIPLFALGDLRERNWGDYAGLSFQEIKEKAGLEYIPSS